MNAFLIVLLIISILTSTAEVKSFDIDQNGLVSARELAGAPSVSAGPSVSGGPTNPVITRTTTPAHFHGYLNSHFVSKATYALFLNLTIDTTSVNFLVSAWCASTDYIAVAFAPTMAMGDAVVGGGGGVAAYSMIGNITPKLNKNNPTYFTSSWYTYSKGYATMAFSIPISGISKLKPIKLNKNNYTIPMSFAIGSMTPTFSYHYAWIQSNVTYQPDTWTFFPPAPLTQMLPPAPIFHGYRNSHLVYKGSFALFLNYTIDALSVNFLVSGKCASTDYLALAFSPTMYGDLIIGNSNGVAAFNMTGHVIPTLKSNNATYFTSSWYSYSNGYATMAFSIPISGITNFLPQSNNNFNFTIPMSFAIGSMIPTFSYHYAWIQSVIVYQVDVFGFVPSSIPFTQTLPTPFNSTYHGYSNAFILKSGAQRMHVNYTIDPYSINFILSAPAQITDFISCDFGSGNDLIVGSAGDVAVFESSVLKPDNSTYFTSSWVKYDIKSSYITMAFSRSIFKTSANDFSLILSNPSGAFPMSFYVGTAFGVNDKFSTPYNIPYLVDYLLFVATSPFDPINLPPFVPKPSLNFLYNAAYNQHIEISNNIQDFYLSYTINTLSINFLVTIATAPLDQIAVNFLSSGVTGYLVVGSKDGTEVQKMDSLNTLPITLTNSSTNFTISDGSFFSFCQPYSTLAFSVPLKAQNQSDFRLSSNGTNGWIPLLFGVGPSFYQYTWIATNLTFQLSPTTFQPISKNSSKNIYCPGPSTAPLIVSTSYVAQQGFSETSYIFLIFFSILAIPLIILVSGIISTTSKKAFYAEKGNAIKGKVILEDNKIVKENKNDMILNTPNVKKLEEGAKKI